MCGNCEMCYKNKQGWKILETVINFLAILEYYFEGVYTFHKWY